MHQEELKEGTGVFASDGDELGEIKRFVLDPDTKEMTHLVIGGGLFADDKVVPFDKIRGETEDGLVLSDEIQEYDDLPPFEEHYYHKRSGPVKRRLRRPGKSAQIRRRLTYKNPALNSLKGGITFAPGGIRAAGVFF